MGDGDGLLERARRLEASAPFDEVVRSYLAAAEARPERAEPLAYLARYCRVQQQWEHGRNYAARGAQIPRPTGGSDIDHDVYDWICADEYAICCYWAGEYAESARVSRALLDSDRLPTAHRPRIEANLRFALEKVGPEQFSSPAQDLARVGDEHRVAYDACPLCQSFDLTEAWVQDWTWRADFDARLSPVIRWMDCAACGHQFTSGYHTPEAFEILFGKPQAGQTPVGMTAAAIEDARTVWTRVVEKVSIHRGQGAWLDVGAGSGMLAGLAHECGFEVTALESREDVAAGIRALGLSVLALDVGDLGARMPETYDVISLCDVLEHLPFPRPGLESVHAAMKPGGLLFISCPNTDSLAWRALNAENANPYWAEVEHFHNFSYRRLRQLLVDHGFEPLSCSVSNRYRVCMDVLARKGAQ